MRGVVLVAVHLGRAVARFLQRRVRVAMLEGGAAGCRSELLLELLEAARRLLGLVDGLEEAHDVLLVVVALVVRAEEGEIGEAGRLDEIVQLAELDSEIERERIELEDGLIR